MDDCLLLSWLKKKITSTLVLNCKLMCAHNGICFSLTKMLSLFDFYFLGNLERVCFIPSWLLSAK